MKESELRFAADALALLNANRIQLRLEYVALISGYALSDYNLGEGSSFGEFYCSHSTNFRWEFGSHGFINDNSPWFKDSNPDEAYKATAEFRAYIDTVERVLNSEDEDSILRYATMSTPYTVEFELSDPDSRMILGKVSYDGYANRYAFTASCAMVNVP
jgi:hypothetical protein